MGKREDRIFKAIENPTKLSDYALIEGRKSNRIKTTKRGERYKHLLPILLFIAVGLSILMSILFL